MFSIFHAPASYVNRLYFGSCGSIGEKKQNTKHCGKCVGVHILLAMSCTYSRINTGHWCWGTEQEEGRKAKPSNKTFKAALSSSTLMLFPSVEPTQCVLVLCENAEWVTVKLRALLTHTYTHSDSDTEKEPVLMRGNIVNRMKTSRSVEWISQPWFRPKSTQDTKVNPWQSQVKFLREIRKTVYLRGASQTHRSIEVPPVILADVCQR